MCKEDIRIARKSSYVKKQFTAPANAPFLIGPSRPDRLSLSLAVSLSNIDTMASITGNIDPATGNVNEAIHGNIGGTFFLIVGDEGLLILLKTLSWYEQSAILRIEDYGPILTEQLRGSFGSAGGGTLNWVETWLEQPLEDV